MGTWIYPLHWTKDDIDAFDHKSCVDEFHIMDLPMEHIDGYLRRIRSCLDRDSFLVNTRDGREKNYEFLLSFGLLDRKHQRQILRNIDSSEFCHIKKTNDGRNLYVFCIDRQLYKAAVGYERALIYIKHDLDESRRPQDLVISFHPLEQPIQLAFEQD